MLYIISLHVISHLRKTKWKRGEVMRQNASKGASPWLGSCMICIKWSCVMHQGPKKCIIVCGLGLAMHQFPQLKPPWFTNMPLFEEFETQCYMRCVWGDQRVGVFYDSDFSFVCHMSQVSFWEAVWCFWWEWFSPWLDSPTTRATGHASVAAPAWRVRLLQPSWFQTNNWLKKKQITKQNSRLYRL